MGRAGLHLKRSDHRKHGADLGSAPGMPVCASWAASPALLPTELRLGLQPLQSGCCVLSSPSSGLPNQKVSRYTMGLWMPWRSKQSL